MDIQIIQSEFNAKDFIEVVGVLFQIGGIIFLAMQFRNFSSQTDAKILSISNQQNLELLDRIKLVPPMVPSWCSLTESGWHWRVFLLNHLNMLDHVRRESGRRFLDRKYLDFWLIKGRFWFSRLNGQEDDEELREGRAILQQLLHPQEGYTTEFRKWLVDRAIVDQRFFLVP